MLLGFQWSRAVFELVEAAGIEPASVSDLLSALHAYPFLNLIAGYPNGGEDQQRSWISFNGSTPGVLHRGPVLGDPRAPARTGTNRAEGAMQVIKLLVRSCRHWQLKVLQAV